jgi:hypothetical protein
MRQIKYTGIKYTISLYNFYSKHFCYDKYLTTYASDSCTTHVSFSSKVCLTFLHLNAHKYATRCNLKLNIIPPEHIQEFLGSDKNTEYPVGSTQAISKIHS